MTFDTLILTVAGWVVGYLTSLFTSEHLERRRTYRGILSLCDSVVTRINDSTDIKRTYSESIPILEPAFVAALGFLKGERREQASGAWASYHSFDPALLPEADFLSRVGIDPHTGGDIITQPDALVIELLKIRACFER